MSRTTRAAGVAACLWTILVIVPAVAEAGVISRACMASGRDKATRDLCNCIQHVANRSLSRPDRRRAAKFFKDPQLAQETRQSDRPADEAFWERYAQFSSRASDMCG
ncbi:MAG: hypothetical protein AAGE13_00955 [Pseudomonadota bacterium]